MKVQAIDSATDQVPTTTKFSQNR